MSTCTARRMRAAIHKARGARATIHKARGMRTVLVAAGAFGAILSTALADTSLTDDLDAKGATPEAQKGYQIAALSDRSDRGFGDSEVEATMVLRNASGQTAERRLTITTLEKADEGVGDKSLVVFESPRDVEGTALLSHAKILSPDDQWLYLPALKRTKRIASANKSGPFVGSEFAFEDFTLIELNKFTYSYQRAEDVNGRMADVIERFPRYERSGYTKQVAWIDQEDRQPRKIEFYDRKGALLKTLTLSDYRQYGVIWRAHRFEMVNHQTGKETDMVYGDYYFGSDLAENDFVKGVLERVR